MASSVDIANVALSHLGIRAKIETFDEDSVEANACRTHWDGLRDLSLRLHDWNFARVTARLEALPDPADPEGLLPARRWRHRHALPADCLRLRRVNGRAVDDPPRDSCEIAAEKDGDGAIVPVLLSDLAVADAVYTARVSDCARWDAGFADAIGRGLAARACYELTGRDDRARTLAQQWQASLLLAAATAANEAPLRALPRAAAARWRR